MIAFAAGCLGGAVLGYHFRVYVLIPTMALNAVLVHALGESLITFFLSAVGLQVGYLACGAIQQVTRTSSSKKIACETAGAGLHTH